MLELRRVRAGIFEEYNKVYPCVNLYDFENAVDEYQKGNEKLLREIIIPGEVVCKLFSIVEIKETSLKQILTGKPLMKSDLAVKQVIPEEDIIAVFHKNRLVAIMKRVDDGDIIAKAEFVYN